MVGKVNPMICQEHALIKTAVLPRNKWKHKMHSLQCFVCPSESWVIRKTVHGHRAEPFLPTTPLWNSCSHRKILGLRKHNDNTGSLAAFCVVLTPQPEAFFSGHFKIHFQLVSAWGSMKVTACFFIFLPREGINLVPCKWEWRLLTKVYPFGLYDSFPQRTGHVLKRDEMGCHDDILFSFLIKCVMLKEPQIVFGSLDEDMLRIKLLYAVKAFFFFYDRRDSMTLIRKG